MTSAQTSKQASKKIDRILAVDDSQDNLFLIQNILEGSNYDIVLVENGQEALAEIRKQPPDLILLDVMMPEMDGYEVTRRIRENKDLAYIPILLITAHNQSSVVTGLDAGADDFIRKPFNIDELMARVRSLLRLKHTMDEREQLSRQREDFVSRLTHDLRTPLVAADRMMNLMRQGAFGNIASSLDEAIANMISSNQNLLHMVNTILEVYRHDAGFKVLTFVTCDVQELVQEVVQELQPLAQERQLQLFIESSEREPDDRITQASGSLASSSAASSVSSPFTVTGDRLELRRVLTNLIGNAIKFTDQGTVTVRLKKYQDNQQQFWATLEVQDTGQGISLDDQAVLFQRFRQGKHKRSGSGLGLYLSHRIIQAHRGTITVQSEVDRGSLFTVRLPVATKKIV